MRRSSRTMQPCRSSVARAAARVAGAVRLRIQAPEHPASAQATAAGTRAHADHAGLGAQRLLRGLPPPATGRQGVSRIRGTRGGIDCAAARLCRNDSDAAGNKARGAMAKRRAADARAAAGRPRLSRPTRTPTTISCMPTIHRRRCRSRRSSTMPATRFRSRSPIPTDAVSSVRARP